MVSQLNGIDAAFLSLESPSGHLQGVGVVRLAPGAPYLGIDELTELLTRRMPRLDVLRHKLVEVPGGLDRPWWVDVVPDLSQHVHHHRLPPGGDPADLERFCADLASTPFDRTRPMWDFWLVDGLPGDAQALVLKVHHSLVDGMGSLVLVGRLFDTDPNAGPDAGPAAGPDAESAGNAAESADDDEPVAAASDVPAPVSSELAPSAPWLLGQAAVNAMRRTVDLVRTGAEVAASAGRLRATVQAHAGAELAVPLATPHLPFDGPISPDRSVALRDLPLDRVKAIAHASGTHVNDVVIAVLAGTLRRWLLAHDALPDQPLVAAVPVSTRGPDELLLPGNHVSALFVHLPTNLADPGARLETAATVATSGKELHDAVGGSMLAHLGLLAWPGILRLPVDVYWRAGLARRHPAAVNLIVSDVPGPTFDLYLAGRRAQAFYALGPIFDGVALNITAVSFRGTLGFGYVTCPQNLDDVTALADGQADALDELAAAFGV